MSARLYRAAIALLILHLAGMQAPATAQTFPGLDTGAVVEPMGGSAAQLSLTNTRSLNFGRFAPGSGGAVTVAASGARSRSGAVILMNSAAAGSASFSLVTLNGSGASKAVILTLPSDGQVVLSNGQFSMPVRNFVSSTGTVFTLPPAGATIDVGATLTVAPSQAAGNYTGSFQVTVNYQ